MNLIFFGKLTKLKETLIFFCKLKKLENMGVIFWKLEKQKIVDIKSFSFSQSKKESGIRNQLFKKHDLGSHLKTNSGIPLKIKTWGPTLLITHVGSHWKTDCRIRILVSIGSGLGPLNIRQHGTKDSRTHESAVAFKYLARS